MKHYSVLFFFLLFSSVLRASIGDTLLTTREFIDEVGRTVYRQIKDVNKIDTAYIEPEHYNFTLMVQNTNSFELYRLRSKSGQSIVLAPRPNIKVGPYFGWRWIFGGYTFDVGHLSGSTRQEVYLSVYSSKIGVDLFYKKAGDDFRIREINLLDDIDTKPIEGTPFSGMDVKMMGFDVYYIFNHHKFSYPAAFSQSTRQKRSSGSMLMGIGYSQHRIGLDYLSLTSLIESKLPPFEAKVDSGFMFDKVRYTDISVSVGYAYNYVPAKNLLIAASLSLALGYKHTSEDVRNVERNFRDFAFNNFVLDGIGRLGFVWNNDRLFAGTSVVFHSYNSRKPQFVINNIFGNFNIYTGWKFGKRKKK